MKPVHQTHFYAGTEKGITRGNCWASCIASLLELPLDEVPHFVDIDEQGGEDWWEHSLRWLDERGYGLHYHHTYPDTDEYVLVTGKSPRGNFHHVVIYKDKAMVHDPHPDSTGVTSQESFLIIREKA